MRTAVKNIPQDAAFTIKAEVRDASGDAWPVKSSTFVSKG
jgi:hypothetical protein